jgi:hypothetical protein
MLNQEGHQMTAVAGKVNMLMSIAATTPFWRLWRT